MTIFAHRSGTVRGALKNNYTLTFILMLVFLAASLASPAIIFADDVPVLLTPANNATGLSTTNITFTWQKFAETTDYYFELSASSSFSSTAEMAGELVSNNQTSYFYSGSVTQLELSGNTKYYWRVMADYPLPSSGWSAVFSFTTKGQIIPTPTPTPTPTATPTVTPTATPIPTPTTNTTGNATNPPGQSSSFSDAIGGFVKSIGLPFILGIIFILIVVVVLIWGLTSKPKKSSPAYGREFGGQPIDSGDSSVVCQNCGFANGPGRSFCANCGSNLFQEPQYQPQFQPVVSPPTPPFQGASFGSGVTCPNCGFANQQGKQFCGNCGSKLMPAQQQYAGPTPGFQQQPQSVFCPNCGAPAQTGQQFCANCGASVSAISQQVIGNYQSFMCPACGATINKGINPCPNCQTFLDWSA